MGGQSSTENFVEEEKPSKKTKKTPDSRTPREAGVFPGENGVSENSRQSVQKV